MFKKQKYLTVITEKLAQLKNHVELQNSIRFFDVNTVAEDFFAKLLNEIYGYSLVNMNIKQTNSAAIDLIDNSNQIAIQVTSERRVEKIQNTLDKFSKFKLEDNFEVLKVLIIGDRTGDYPTLKIPEGILFSGKDDVIDLKRLLRDISNLGVDKLENIVALLNKELISGSNDYVHFYSIETHIDTSESRDIRNCQYHGKLTAPTCLETSPKDICSEWLVERLKSQAHLKLYEDHNWSDTSIWFVIDVDKRDGVVINLDQRDLLRPPSPTTTTQAPSSPEND